MEKSKEDSQFKEEFKLEMPEVRTRRRRKKKASKPVFKKYEQKQMNLLPQSLDELIEEKHIVRVVNKVIEQLNVETLVATYKGGGTSSYNPVMLLKVWVYAILMKVYSGRQIAKSIKENIHYMWLSGGNRPDFRTLNDFRSGRLSGVIEDIFVETVLFLGEKKLVDLKKYFADGTTFGANANKYTYVWKKNTKRYKEIVQKRVREIFQEINTLNQLEDKEYGNKDLEEYGEESQLSSEDIKQEVEKLNKIINESALGKAEKKKIERLLKKVETKEVPKIQKYEQQEEILGERKSYSKTDEDATFMKMKNKQILPGYMIMAGTENQYIVNYSIHNKGSESASFISNMEQYFRYFNRYPEKASADSAYGTEENCSYLEEKQIDNYLKYSSFHKEQTKEYKENKFHKDHLDYDEQTDSYQCPNNRQMIFKEQVQTKTVNGYIQTIRKYQCVDCGECPFASICKKGEGNRTIQINKKLETYKDIMRENLKSEEGLQLRKQRNVDVETVFADIKWNQGFTRFRLRGKTKVNVEFGLLSIAHNLKKAGMKIN